MTENESEFDILWKQFLEEILKEFKGHEEECGCDEVEFMESYRGSRDEVQDFYDFLCVKNGVL